MEMQSTFQLVVKNIKPFQKPCNGTTAACMAYQGKVGEELRLLILFMLLGSQVTRTEAVKSRDVRKYAFLTGSEMYRFVNSFRTVTASRREGPVWARDNSDIDRSPG